MEGFNIESIFFLIIFLLVSAFSWITNKLQERKARQEMERSMEADESPAEASARRREPTTADDLRRRLMESLGIPLEEEPPPPPPPPVPASPPSPPPEFRQAPPPMPAVTLPSTPRPTLNAAEKAALERIQQQRLQAGSALPRRRRTEENKVRALLTPGNIRSAVILKEILDQPKGLR